MHDGFVRTVRPDHQQSGRLLPLAQDRQQIDGRRVTPVKVLEHEHERLVGRERFHQDGELPQHPLGSDELQAAFQGLRVVVLTNQPWRLRQPRRRHPPQQFAHPARVEPTRESPERFEHRHVRLPRSQLLDAEAPRH